MPMVTIKNRACILLLVFVGADTSAQISDEISLVEIKGDCIGLAIEHNGGVGLPTAITFDGMAVDTNESQPDIKSCILVYEINAPEGYQVGITGLAVSGLYRVQENALAKIELTYKFTPSPPGESKVIEQMWREQNQEEMPFSIHADSGILWSPCGNNTLAIFPVVLASPTLESGQSNIQLLQIDMDYLIYKRCS
jgi:Domain of unknown function (DUF4360)